MPLQYHLHLDSGDVAPYVLLPGDPGRVPLVAARWDEARHVATSREYVTYTGTYRGAPITCTSTGIGCPSTAIAMEELARVGATTFIRIGTCGTFQDDVPNGTMAIFDSAARYDGASRLYAPIEFAAVASHEVVVAAVEAAQGLDYPHVVGTTRSADTFYALTPARARRSAATGSRAGGSTSRTAIADRCRGNGGERDLRARSPVGLRAGGVSVVLDNVLTVSGESGEFDPESQIEHGADQIERLARIGCEIVRALQRAGAAS